MVHNPRAAGLRRRALLGLLPDGPGSSSSAASATATAASTTQSNPGLLNGLSSAIGGITSDVNSAVSGLLPPPKSSSSTTTTSSSSTTSSTSTSSSSSSSTSSSSSSSSSSASSASSTSSSSSSTTTSSSSQITPTPQASPAQDTSSLISTYVTTSNDQVLTVTATMAAESTAPAKPATSKAFLQNKPAMGVVFALAGIVALVILVVISTWFLRRSRRNRLERAAESFNDVFPDPDGLNGFPGEKIARTASGRTNTGSDEALIGSGYSHRRVLSDNSIVHDNVARPPGQMKQAQPGGFTPLPPPPGLTGPRQQPAVMPNPYESPYGAYQSPAGYPNGPPAYGPPPPQRAPTVTSNNSAWSGPPPAALYPARQQLPQEPQPAQIVLPRRSNSPPTTQRPISNTTFGNDSLRPSGGSPENRRDSNESDAYADYAYSTGPGQQGGPRGLTIANA